MVNSTACHEKQSAKYSFSCNALLISGRTVKIPQNVLQNPTRSGKLHERDLAFFQLEALQIQCLESLTFEGWVCVCVTNMKHNVGFTPMEKKCLKLIK